MKTQHRRLFLKTTVAGGMAGVAAGAGLLAPSQVLGADWSAKSFEAKNTKDAVTNLFGSDAAVESSEIHIKAPDIAENGAVVPIKVSTAMDGVESIAILIDKNSSPLTAVFNLGPTTLADVSTRVKMGKTSDVIALVKVGGKVYSAKKEVKVTIGGCGG